MNRSNISSFTVEDDLISESSLNSTFTRPRAFAPKPFSKDFGARGAAGSGGGEAVPTLQRRIAEQAQNEAYRQLNNDLFNPFEHKLHHGFASREGDLYERQKQKQIELIKKREMDLLSASRNYTIVFNNSAPQGRSLKLAASSILAEEPAPSISDYYQQKFKKKTSALEEIGEEEEPVKKNNFLAEKPVKRAEKGRNGEGSGEEKRAGTGEKPKIIKSSDGWRKEANTEKEIDISCKREEGKREEGRGTSTPACLPKPLKPPTRPLKPETTPPPLPKKSEPARPRRNNYSQSRPEGGKGEGGKGKGGKRAFSEVYEGADRGLVEQLEREITECPSISFEDIAELESAKGLLQEAVLLPRMMPEFFKGIRKAMRGVLLFGPPGTGKTLLAKAIASNGMFFNVSAASLASKWKGDSEKMVRLLFELARYHSPSVIFFDEIDSIATKRSENEHESARKVKTELLVQMDGVGNSDQSVFVLAATNRPWDLDEALRRRLEKRIYIPLPGKEGRRKMLELNLKGVKVGEGVDWEKVVELTKGCSGADICNICRDAAYMPMRRKLAQVGGILKIAELSQRELLNESVTEADLLEAARKIRPSVGTDDLKRYSDWMKEFGSS